RRLATSERAVRTWTVTSSMTSAAVSMAASEERTSFPAGRLLVGVPRRGRGRVGFRRDLLPVFVGISPLVLEPLQQSLDANSALDRLVVLEREVGDGARPQDLPHLPLDVPRRIGERVLDLGAVRVASEDREED